MIDFLDITYMTILSICFLVSLVDYCKPSRTIFWVNFYITVTFFVEWIAFYSLNISDKRQVSVELYNLYIPFSFFIISGYFSSLLKSNISQIFLGISVPIVLLFYILKDVGDISFLMLNYKTYMVTFAITTIYCILYFIEILKEDFDLLPNANFWIVTGMLFFYSGFFFLSGFINFLAGQDKVLARKLFSINHILNIIYYSLITYGFICQRRLAKSSL